MLLDMIDNTCQTVIRKMAETGYSYDQTKDIIASEFPDLSPEIFPCLFFICNSIVPGLQKTTDELSYFGLGLDGDYVLPGPSGDPTRGNAHLLPTGKNCYSIDPATIPTPSAWKTGKELADTYYGNKDPVSVTGDASDPDNVKTRKLDEEIRFTVRSRVLNPAWLEGLKPHGFRGAQEIVTSVEYMFGWDATSDVIDDWEYQSVAEHFLFNEENRKWIEENNPYAIHSISGRLLEANQRGMWETDKDTIQKLQQLYLKAEEFYEGTG